MRLAAGLLVAACLVAGPVRARDGSLDGLTAGVLIGGAAALVAYDVYLATSGHRTISQTVGDASWNANVLPYMAGVLAGHLFLPSGEREHWQVALATVPIVVLYDLMHHEAGRPAWRHPGIAFGIGLGVGALTWSRKW